MSDLTAEEKRLAEAHAKTAKWLRWGPYLSERQWGTVREDYSADGNAWNYFTHDMARSRAYRWGEDGLAGFSDNRQRICLALGLWNGNDPILKERLFGLTGPEGNHGEDVKEYYYYLDATPTHSYMRMLYKYPQAEYPYAALVEQNRLASKDAPEYELIDTGIFASGRYFDVDVEYAKAGVDDLLWRMTITNRGDQPAPLWVLPQVWFRNTWSWGTADPIRRPRLEQHDAGCVLLEHPDLPRMYFQCAGDHRLLFTENETNRYRLYNQRSTGYVKDAFHDYVVHDRHQAVNPSAFGTKCAAVYQRQLAPGESWQIQCRLSDAQLAAPWDGFDAGFAQRLAEADTFYAKLQRELTDDDARNVQRQAFAGMIWSKQYYHYDVKQWLDGDPTQPSPAPQRKHGRNTQWRHMNNADVISMPDKWEYPWYAAWDLAFHCLPLALVDSEFAKKQLVLMTREWYMHANGQLPAYEWAFGDVNPPVHAWGAWRVYQIDRKYHGRGDRAFLERVFHKLLLNFTWWVNRKDEDNRNVFQGGFLGLDNIGVFDRSAELVGGGHIDQADGTSWMAMYSLNMMRIALELAEENPVYEDIASKFFEHFLYIAHAMNHIGGDGIGLWDEEDEFYYDVLHMPGLPVKPMKVRSLVGLTPLFAVETLEPEMLERFPGFRARTEWLLKNRPELSSLVSRWTEPGRGDRRLLSLLRGHRMKRLLHRMLDPNEFLSDFGIRGLSRYHKDHPFVIQCDGRFRRDGGELRVDYEPAESRTSMFGGNSNWRGPVWFPMNFLIIESLQKFHHYYGDDFRIEMPTGSGQFTTIQRVADELSRRLCRLFLRNEQGERPVFRQYPEWQTDPHFRDHLLFYEYFHGDTGRGVGASHQTGWTGLVAKLLQPRAEAIH